MRGRNPDSASSPVFADTKAAPGQTKGAAFLLRGFIGSAYRSQ